MNDLISEAISRFNAINSEDPTTVETGKGARPRELLMAERLEQWVLRVDPEASFALRLASRCQHLKRFAFPRSEYPEGRVGYLTWRKELSRKHADLASGVLRQLGAADDLIAEVRRINMKQELKSNPDSQKMEDALCLSFLQHEYAPFAEKHEDEKVIDIVKKTWGKMSDEAHQLALALPLAGRAKDLVVRALSGDE